MEEVAYELRTKTDDSGWTDWRVPVDGGLGIRNSVLPELLDYPITVSVTVCKDLGLGSFLWTEYRIKEPG